MLYLTGEGDCEPARIILLRRFGLIRLRDADSYMVRRSPFFMSSISLSLSLSLRSSLDIA